MGVTGHRNFVSDDPNISALVRKELRRILRANNDAPLLILSGLAEGADRLVARVARDEFGAACWAILPLPDGLYVRDFATRISVGEYRYLKGVAQRVIEAPLLFSRRSVARHGEPRNHQYAWSGAYIAKRAQILLAIWDGAPAQGTGGSAHVVDWFLSGNVPRKYRISRAPRVPGHALVANWLVHINPCTQQVKRHKCLGPHR